ncbi:alpha-ketoacid dehydrogenase subunit alpha/beta [Gracilimonas mengyeensis]|uniref:2-oxoisovalerate dehydrogenase E1 component n=1 Tax=Gracilimonas mengyeensis TaxID=1302730 RepID=A0A521AE61_9BACT|nr:alpha-ketoacid dehydrogenase subunit alpha/beta [Gracilimonas mengyeensis]SMO33071.1 2-oxoisovalerate dehydrogenase E1 component [Gracilimonas mengyeensis]
MAITEKKISAETALYLYKNLLLPRRIEERMLMLLRQNKISKWFSGIGQEAVGVGVALSSEPEDYILPMHRNLGVFTARNVPLYPLFCQLFGKADGFTQGRDRSFHFGIPEHKIIGMISHLAAMMPVADGLALAMKLREEKAVAFSFCGDGATSEGDFHEALNLAAVWKLPVVFIIENNGYGLSTPTSEQYACEHLSDRAKGYGMHGFHIDGNNIFEVMKTVGQARELALKGEPVLIEAKTFRMRGHEEASGTHYVPDNLFEDWAEKDPIHRFELYIESEGLFTQAELEEVTKEIDQSFKQDLEKALDADDPVFEESKELARVYTPTSKEIPAHKDGVTYEHRFVDAIQASLRQAFEEDSSFLIMGQDIAEYGGVFKITEGFLDQFGKERIRNTPIIESGALGAALGLSLEGFKPVVEMQFADFISCGFNQIVNNIAKSQYRWSPSLNITIRAPHGGGVGAGPFHSQSVEGWFMQVPGLKVVVPGTVEDAMNLLYGSLYDPNPVLFFEHKKLYRSLRAKIPDKANFEPLGKAKVRREGTDATIITYGMGVQWALETAGAFESKGRSIEILDLRTLLPLDKEAIKATVQKTGRVLLLQEPSLTLGPLSEISAIISEECFEWLDAPVMRCASLDMPIPHDKGLEAGFMADRKLSEKIERLIRY